jgi:hypothetical protein
MAFGLSPFSGGLAPIAFPDATKRNTKPSTNDNGDFMVDLNVCVINMGGGFAAMEKV